MQEQISLLEDVPQTIRRPLTLIDGIGYAATWLPSRVVKIEQQKDGTSIRKEVTEDCLFILRDDGKLFTRTGQLYSEGETRSEELSLDIVLPEAPPKEKVMSKLAVDLYQKKISPDVPSTFSKITQIVDYFIDFDRSIAPQQIMTEMVACYILATWFSDAFNVMGMLWPTGDRGSGKTQLLLVVTELAYLGILVLAGGSYATLRDLSDYGATIAFDDAENMTNEKRSDPDKRALLLAGNRKGSCVTVKEQGRDNKWKTRVVSTYCPRLFSATQLPDPILESRSIIVPLIRTANRVKANTEPCDYNSWPHNKELLLIRLWQIALSNLKDLPAYEQKVNDRAALSGRNLEPWKSVLAVALWLEHKGVDGLYKRIESLSLNYQKERIELREEDFTTVVIKAVCRCASVPVIPIQDREYRDSYSLSLPYSLSPKFGTTGTSKHKKASFTVEEITKCCREIAEEEYLELPISNEKVGRVLTKLRFAHTPRPGGKGSRKREVPLKSLISMAEMYGVDHGLYPSLSMSPDDFTFEIDLVSLNPDDFVEE